MRVAFDARMVTWKGVGTYSLELLRALAKHASVGELRLLCFRRPEDEFLQDDPQLASLDWRVIPGSVWSPLSLAKMAWAARYCGRTGRVGGREPVDLFHSPHFVVPPTYRGPLVATIFDLIPLDLPETMPNAGARSVFSQAVRFTAARADMVLCMTRFAATRFEAHDVHPRDLRVIPGAASPRLHPVGRPEIERVARGYGLPPGYILWLGAFRAHKNVGTLIDAFGRLPLTLAERHPLVLAGSLDGPEVTALQQQAAGTGYPVLFPGRILAEDMAALYSGAEVFVFPSLTEGFGLPPLEAAASGAPVLCSRAEPLPEVMGTGAAYFDPMDPAALAALLEHVLDSPEMRRRLAKAGRLHAARSSWRQTAETTVRAYRDVLARRAGGRKGQTAADAHGNRAKTGRRVG